MRSNANPDFNYKTPKPGDLGFIVDIQKTIKICHTFYPGMLILDDVQSHIYFV